MPEKPKNFLEALFQAGATGVGTAAGQVVQAGQQDKQNALAELSAVMNFESQQRATQAHGQRMALGRLNLKVSNEKLKNLQMSAYEIHKEKLGGLEGFSLDELQRLGVPLTTAEGATQSFGALTGLGELPTGASATLGGITFKGEPFTTSRITRPTETDKELALFQGKYPPELFSQIERTIRAGNVIGEDERNTYEQLIGRYSPKGPLGQFEGNAPAQARAATEAGYSPELGKTKLQVLMSLEDKLRIGGMVILDTKTKKKVKLTKDNIDIAKKRINDYFDNLYENTLSYAEEQ